MLLLPLVLVAVSVLCFYLWLSRDYKLEYWSKLGVPYVDLSKCASVLDLFLGRVSVAKLDEWTYKQGEDAPFIGVFDLSRPRLVVRDLDLLKAILIKDFDHFLDRRPFKSGNSIIDQNLFFSNGPGWRHKRIVMSPVFSTSKIRRLFPHMERSTFQFKQYISSKVEETRSNEIELRDFFGRYTMDVIAGAVFGIDAKCLTDDDSVFMKMGRTFQETSIFRTIKMMLAFWMPRVYKWTGFELFGNKTSTSFFFSIIRKAIQLRKNKGQNFQDFIGAFVNQAYGKSKFKVDEGELDRIEKDMVIKSDEGDEEVNFEMTDEAIIGDSMNFFFAGFDVIESLMTIATYQMALNPEIQTKLREEVDAACEEFGGKITYEGITKMQYLDQVLRECLRLYPPASAVDRVVTKPYKVAGSDLTLPVGLLISVPILGIHMDPRHYKEPEKFDPERFSPENSAGRNHYAWLPFGHGPRGCIAMRFGMVQAKAAIAHLVRSFEMRPCKDTCVPLKMDNILGTNKPSKGLKVAMYPRA